MSAAMPMIRVQSSQIAAIGYAPESGELSVMFKGKGDAPGALYVYDGVSADDYAALASAESVGSHFAQHIKRGGFGFRRVESANVVIEEFAPGEPPGAAE